MNVGQLLAQLRLELSDTVATLATVGTTTVTDALWGDPQLITYLNWAEREFVGRTRCFRDISTPAICVIPLVTGQNHYPLDPRILAVLSASLNAPPGAPNAGLWPLTYSDINPSIKEEYAGVTLYPPGVLNDAYALPSVSPAPPTPKGWVVDEASNTLTIYPMFTGTWPWTTTPAVNLRVTRLPLYEMNPLLLTMTPETPYQYHLPLIWGAAWQALLTTDVDGNAPEAASSFQERFEMAITEAKRDMVRRFRKQPRVAIGGMGRW